MKKKLVAFRGDSDKINSSGHFSRCLAISQGLKKYKIGTIFLSINLYQNDLNILKKNGIKYILLSKNNSYLQINHYNEKKLIQKIKKEKYFISHLFIDSYFIKTNWKVFFANITIIKIYDSKIRKNKNYDYILNNNIEKIESDYLFDYFLIGSKFVVLKNIYTKIKKKIIINKSVKNILISFSAVDLKKLTLKVLNEIIKNKLYLKYTFTVIISSNNLSLFKLITITKKYNIKVVSNIENLSKHYLNADIAIGSGGISLWERCYFGLPSIIIRSSKKQTNQINYCNKLNLILPANFLMTDLSKKIEYFSNNYKLRKSISNNCKLKIDAMGVDRIISVLNLLNMKVKKISIKDKKNILKWRNHESILKISFSKKITIAEHHKWFSNLLNNKNYLGLIYDNGFKKLAVVIF